MTLAVLPNDRVRRVERRLVTAGGRSLSPFTGIEQVQAWGGAWWAYAFEIGPFEGDEGRRYDAILQGLGGMTSTFLFADPTAARDDYSLGQPTVDGSGQSGSSLVTTGWTPLRWVLKAGHFVSLGTDEATRLHMVTADVVSNASGEASLPIVPALRASPADGAAIEYAAPKVRLRLTGKGLPASMDPGIFYRFSIDAREAT